MKAREDNVPGAPPGPAPRIHILPEEVRSRIAAGEVIERPASVLKELVENSLDAGARAIHVQIEGGGRELIRVADDGCGMGPADLALSVRRHATSKLRQAEDLYALTTLGFRGEALPAIGSVSRLTIVSRMRGSEQAWRLEVRGGQAGECAPAAGSVGTSVEVRDLFYNLPVRRKFLKGAGPEASGCTDMLVRLALARPDVAFVLHQGRQEIFSCPAVAEAPGAAPGALTLKAYAQRARELLGRDAVADLVPVAVSPAAGDPKAAPGAPWPQAGHDARGNAADLPPASGAPFRATSHEHRATSVAVPPASGLQPTACAYRLSGLLCRPDRSRPNRSQIYLAVNARPVRDRTLLVALTEAYRQWLPPRRFPAGVLFLELPAAEVDINVHPTKAEVRFRYPGLVFALFHQAVRETFGPGAANPTHLPQRHGEHGLASQPTAYLAPHAAPFSVSPSLRGEVTDAAGQRFNLWKGEGPAPPRAIPSSISAEAPTAYGVAPPPAPSALSLTAPGRVRKTSATEGTEDTETGREQSEDVSVTSVAGVSSPGARARAAAVLPEMPSFRVLGQAGGAFIVLEDEEGVKLLDQHAVHERVLFEELQRTARAGARGDSQGLLLPETIELTPTQAAAFSDPQARAALTELGFEMGEFGQRSVAVQAVPAVLKRARVGALVAELLDALAGAGDEGSGAARAPSRVGLREKAAYMLACKGAIKAGERLTVEQMTALVDQFLRCGGAAGATCPHGRPVAVELSWDELDRKVGRT